MAKGGYSISLEPEPGSDVTWFTKGTIERFVRFVSTPEILERVYNLESELLQIEEAIAIQGNNDMGLSTVEDYHVKPVESTEGSRPVLDSNEEKAIVLYKPGANTPEANGSTTQEGNSKVQLLKVLETRRTVLQKEQGMAFARAVAAGFDTDHMSTLMSFAECFGALRLMDACTKFLELWKRKHETGQWLEIEAAEAMSSRSEFSAMNASGIMLANVANPKEYELASENNGKASSATSADDKPPMDYQPPSGHQEYFQGQFPHHMFPSWPVHSPPGAPPVYQAYPMQGMPYYQNYPGNGPFFQPPYPSVSDPRLNAGQRMGHRRHSMDSRDSNTELEGWEMDASKTRSQDEVELEKEASQTRESRKKASRSGKKQSGVVVIRNINYITSKRQNSSDTESQSASDSETDEEGGDLEASALETRHMDSQRSSKRKGNRTKSMDKLNSSNKEETAHGKDVDGGHWQAFQNYLLRDDDEDKRAADQGMFAMEKEVQAKRRQNTVGDDPLAFSGQGKGGIQENNMIDMHTMGGNMTYMRKDSNNELLISRRDGQPGDGRRSMDVQSTELDGRRGGYRRTGNDDFMINRRESQSDYTSSTSDPLVNGFDRVTNNLDKKSSHDMDDDSYIVALRANSLDQVGNNDRNAIDLDSEFPSASQLAENASNRVGSQVNYEPDELSLMPERGTEKYSIGYDPALDYEMQIRAEDGASLDKKHVEVDIKQGSKKSDKERKSRLTPDTSDKKKTVGPIRKGRPSKLSPLDEARARADRLRTFKADLQKMKKEKEEEEMKRIEALKIERQKRIAARGSSNPAKSPLPSNQTKKQLPTKLSPSSHKVSKFSDSEPGSSSPLNRFPIKTASVGSSDSQKASKPSSLNTGSHSAGNKLSRSVSSLPEPKKENSSVPSDAKASMARIRRLSEPKMGSSHHVSSVKSQSAEPVSKRKISDGPESKKLSAIVNYDKSKAATLPELKIRTSKGPDVARTKSAAKEMTQKVNGKKSSTTSEGAELKRNNENISHHSDGDDNPVIEKTVVMLECDKPSVPTVHALEEIKEAQKGQYDNFEIRKKSELVSDYAAIRAPVSPLSMDRVDGESSEHQSHKPAISYEVTTVNADKEPPKFSSIGIADKSYQAPYARVSSLEDPCTGNSEYGKAPPSSEIMTTGTETVKALVSDSRNLRLEKIPESLEKPQVKDSSKGFRRLLKFGRKNHSSATGERNIESDNASIISSEADDSGTNTASTSEESKMYTSGSTMKRISPFDSGNGSLTGLV
uniref:COP1-interacting protein 7 n=1 Tax=Fagus sylvatica TaxID=28930 RepID=A0A2N9GHT8_FAGSY